MLSLHVEKTIICNVSCNSGAKILLGNYPMFLVFVYMSQDRYLLDR